MTTRYEAHLIYLKLGRITSSSMDKPPSLSLFSQFPLQDRIFIFLNGFFFLKKFHLLRTDFPPASLTVSGTSCPTINLYKYVEI